MALVTELNRALAPKADVRVKSVDFVTVWSQDHAIAGRTGSAEANLIPWVGSCLA